MILTSVSAWGEQGPTYVVLLAGQSNMEGAASFDQLDAADKARLEATADRVQMSNQGDKLGPVDSWPSGWWEQKLGYRDVFGPEVFVAITLHERFPDQRFVLIKHAVGGTSLYGAWNPEWSLERSQRAEKGERKHRMKLFEEHIGHTQRVIEDLTRQGQAPQVMGLLWMQGENDAAEAYMAREYRDNLERLIAAYRTRMGLPDMPVVCGQINSTYGQFAEGPEMVRDAIARVTEADPVAAMVATSTQRPYEDFPKVDGTHYDAEGQKRLGTAMGEKLIDLQSDSFP
jgi:hypothetical protein